MSEYRYREGDETEVELANKILNLFEKLIPAVKEGMPLYIGVTVLAENGIKMQGFICAQENKEEDYFEVKELLRKQTDAIELHMGQLIEKHREKPNGCH